MSTVAQWRLAERVSILCVHVTVVVASAVVLMVTHHVSCAAPAPCHQLPESLAESRFCGSQLLGCSALHARMLP